MATITKQFKISQYTNTYWGILYTPDNLTTKVPLVVFCHGAGETGRTQADTSKLYTNGPLNFIKSGWKPDFAILAMQDGSWSTQASAIDYVLKNDPDVLKAWNGKDCLVTGLSAGGESTVLYMDNYNNPSFAYVPMSPAGDSKLKNPSWPHRTWFFSGDTDYHFTDTAKALATATNGKITIFKGGHCCWNSYYNPSYRENGQNIYEWAFGGIVSPEPTTSSTTTSTTKAPVAKTIVSIIINYSDGTSDTIIK